MPVPQDVTCGKTWYITRPYKEDIFGSLVRPIFLGSGWPAEFEPSKQYDVFSFEEK
ncbi:unnamed protein product [Dovyalis caffra]|uniref:Uncharacterized protein n=1 Tax=Dovyalis caffra TaxID=77055 RepID=A0AAV1SNE6_9ROSI|nr:unnamed protein product [Dovyalis caffra]